MGRLEIEVKLTTPRTATYGDRIATAELDVPDDINIDGARGVAGETVAIFLRESARALSWRSVAANRDQLRDLASSIRDVATEAVAQLDAEEPEPAR